jgi:hypothetical protein
MYAAMVGGGATSSNALLIALALLELCAVGIGATRRTRVLVALLLLLALASQVGCNTGGGVSPTVSGTTQSTQTAMHVEAMKQENNASVSVVGLPVVMGTVSVSVK